MLLFRLGVPLLVFLVATSARAQSSVPTVVQSIPAQTLAPGGDAVTLDMRNYIGLPGVVGSRFAQFETIFGRFNVEMRGDVAPQHVANFFAYVEAGRYTNTFIHRSAVMDASGSIGIVQGGGYTYRLPFEILTIPKFDPVPLEYNLANARGTLAAARMAAVNTATSEWFFNVRDNSNVLNQSNGGGYTVFGRVLGTGMSVVDQIAALPRFNAGGAFNDLPLRNYTSGNANENNLVVIQTVREATLFPTGGGSPSVVQLSVQNSAPGVVETALSGSTLTVTPLSPGNANLTIRAVDTHGSAAEASFAVSVAATPTVFTGQPVSQTVAAGSTVVFNAPTNSAAAFRWERNGVAIEGATGSTLVIPNATAALSGNYVAVATNSIGTVNSSPATLAVVNTEPISVGRLVNLSILTVAGSGAKVLTMGTVVGPGTGTLPLVIRAVGPTLALPPFFVPGVLPDPVMTFFAQGNPVAIDSNDNWGGGAALSAAFAAVGAFALPAASLDAALVRTAPGVNPGGYTVQVTGKADASGAVIAELYEAAGAARTATTPRLVNLSTLTQIDAGTELAVGFVIGGQTARTVLVRGIGPSLVRFEVPGLMTDPKLELFNNDTGARLGSNDDWSGNLEIATVSSNVGAFPLIGGNSKDAVMLVTLAPGAYSARVSGVNATGGTAIVEVYEVP
jgi:cyclophilin family peptidyl-prolyl cis-trans isomerase